MSAIGLELPTLSKTFSGPAHFRQRVGAGYALLPFRFLALDDERYIATNFVGQFIVLHRDELTALVRHRLPIESTVYEELKSRHFVLDNDSSVALDLLACKYRTKQSALGQLTSLFLFVVTLRCEHSCPYCQVSRQSQDRRAFDMSQAHAKKAIDFVFASPSPSLKIEFQGGEPLLNFELIRWIVEQVNERNLVEKRDIAFVITSNLAVLTEEMLDFCQQNHVLISTSLDGPRELHNANRPRPGGDSYERAVTGIALARRTLGFDQVSALMTTTRPSLDQPEAIVDEYVALGFRSIFLRSLSPFGFAVKTGAAGSYSTSEWLVFYKRALAYIIELNANGTHFREEYAALLLRKMLTPYSTNYVDLQSPAGIGINCLALNYDGRIYASDEARMLAEMGDYSFCLGHLDTTSFQQAVTCDSLVERLASTMTEVAPMCADCGVQPYCGSDPVYHHATQGDSVGHKPTSGFCNKNMEIIRHLVRLLEDDAVSAGVLRQWAY